MSVLRSVIMVALAFAASLVGAPDASAQSYPTRTVRFILPFGPGSGTDIAARVVADRLAVRWNTPVVIENRPGGDSLVSINAFISANDDHTLLWMPVGNFVVHPFEHEKLSYDADRDLLPIANVTTLPLSASVPASLPVGSLREFVELVRSQPNKFNAAAASGSSDFLMGGFLQSNGLQMAKIPYRDIMQGPGDLGEGRLHLLMSSFTIVQPLMQSGKVKVLAVTTRQRAPNAPDVPTMTEAGFPAFQLDSPGGLFGPRGMPLSLRERIAEDVRIAAADPMVAARLQATSQVLTILGPNEFAANIKSIQDKIATFAQATGKRPSR